jgi:hypothetical protein
MKWLGIVGYNPEETVVDVVNMLPENTYMVILYTPIEQHIKRITNSVNEMAVDQIVSRLEKPCTSNLLRFLKLISCHSSSSFSIINSHTG